MQAVDQVLGGAEWMVWFRVRAVYHSERLHVMLHGKPILERNCGTQPLSTILFQVLLVSVLYELCVNAGQRVCVQLLSASSLPAARVGVVSQ